MDEPAPRIARIGPCRSDPADGICEGVLSYATASEAAWRVGTTDDAPLGLDGMNAKRQWSSQ